ncbi:hypothetical protein LOC71_22245 [Rhodopirellula sp. JC740]|uniref:site-specific DNA-methyltransferase (adenine-specific) n=1 Tax=Rhodopirellula halodulae TaxID=2894198 RepID=A0ABS8NPW5_9BACT|nr:hypothetical protein [Rhodopirellula sp. JC740]
MELLIEAAERDWQQVEPAIFGTMLERALDPVERHKLGAHYTPRAYVERLVVPTIIEPLREKWTATYAAAIQLDDDGKQKEAIALLRDFHGELCETRVLDPACGSGNFLYVAMELMKKLEGEVVNALSGFDDDVLPGVTIDPHQFLGIEVNPRAAALAELVLWIGFIQWHRRTRDELTPPIPILKDYKNIECRDAILKWDAIEPVLDDNGKRIARWDGRTTKPNLSTGEDVPDQSSIVEESRYINPREADWPTADYIVGNPPFIGGWKLRQDLGNGYTDAIWSIGTDIPNKADYVMYWWNRAARLVKDGSSKRFGFITTNSIRMQFNRRVVGHFLDGERSLAIRFAVPDHPWVDSANGADVRISMTVAELKNKTATGVLETLVPTIGGTHATRGNAFTHHTGIIQSNLTIGPDLDIAIELKANHELSFAGVKLHGAGFILKRSEAEKLKERLPPDQTFIRPFMNGRDLTKTPRDVFVIDFFGYSVDALRELCPEVLDCVIQRVKPERDQNRSKSIRDNWWIHGRARGEMRASLQGIDSYIATAETAKHRFFVFLPSKILPDNKLITIASNDPYVLGVLSSRPHCCWAIAFGGRMGVGNDPVYQNTRCFEPYPFPAADQSAKLRIGKIAKQLDGHRKRQQELHPKLTMTGMYNVLEKLRSEETLNSKEQAIHEQGLVSVMMQIHDDLDAAVFDAYGWPHDLEDEAILQRLVDLNQERADEESRGLIRWLRPEFQNPDGVSQTAFANEATKKKAKKTTTKIKKQPWPKSLPDRMVAIQNALQRHGTPADVKQIAAYYTRANKDNVAELLETLEAVGNVRQIEDGRYVSMQAKAG